MIREPRGCGLRPSQSGCARPYTLLILAALLVIVIIAGYLLVRRGALPGPGSTVYRDTVSAFYVGLAALDVGDLLDNAETAFLRAGELIPEEPATWANLGVLHLRRGDFEDAARYLEQAQSLAPSSSEIAVLQGILDSLEGRLEASVAHLRRAVELDPRNVRALYMLAQGIERAGDDGSDAEAQALLDDILTLDPDNLAVLVEHARLGVKLENLAVLRDSITRLGTLRDTWPELATQQYRALEQATADADLPLAARSVTFLRNVLLSVPEFRADLMAVGASETIADPVEQFLALVPPRAAPSPLDEGLEFSAEPIDVDRTGPWTTLLATALEPPVSPTVFLGDDQTVQVAGTADTSLSFPSGSDAVPPSAHAILAIDWDHDFRMDLVLAGGGGLRLFRQTDDGTFADVTLEALDASVTGMDCFGVWAADIDMDGDLDVVVGLRDLPTVVLRNNGDGTFLLIRPFPNVTSVRSFVWADLDLDGDPDAGLLDAEGMVHVFRNEQGGLFRPWPTPAQLGAVAGMTIGDLNADGLLDLVVLEAGATVQSLSATGDQRAWVLQRVTTWATMPAGARAGAYRLFLADLDNNGGLDLVGSGPTGTQVWLSDEVGALRPHAAPNLETFSVADLSSDGLLDLVGLADGRPVAMLGQSLRAYHWQVIRARATQAAGDQRINSFGVGGEIEIRTGLLVQKQILTGAPVHFGLGTRTSIDVARIVWPNGVMQAEFDLAADQEISAEQRLKGSCPWVFAYDGSGMQFVTDFLWRSPLGLRINGQDTAGITQTEDWVKIRADQLTPKDGLYDIRITGELWETHFIDHLALMTVDHPADLEVFVDEGFAANAPPSMAVHALQRPQPVARAWDDMGHDVTDIVRARDGRYLGTFGRGAYQGITRDHFVEIDLGDADPDDAQPWLLAQGWVYPTDSSINLAIAQGTQTQPRGVALEVRDASGEWVVVSPDLGFPAGKNKTMVIDLSDVFHEGQARRLRLRTNLEVYWDWLAYAAGVEPEAIVTRRLDPVTAELRYRGFSRTSQAGPQTPEIPHYDQIANTTQRWRDLTGYHTRFGDVRPLLAQVDDRYVIMNAGDELQALFPTPAPPPAGWTRDFVLIGDGWVKDGDYNTAFSKTVRPLPSHEAQTYQLPAGGFALDNDPAYRLHPDDWQTYHTRFVTPQEFLSGSRPRRATTQAK